MEIQTTKYNAQVGRDEPDAMVDLYPVAKALTPEAMAYVLETWANSMGRSGYGPGVRIGRLLHTTHRYLQAEIIDTLLGICAGMGEQDRSDARNELQIKMARQVESIVGIPTQAIR